MSTKKKSLRFRPIAILLMASVIALSAASAFGVDVGDFSYSYNLSTKEGTITAYRGSSSHVTIPTSFTVAETYKDDDGETHTRHHTITVTGIGSSVFANKTFITSVSFHTKLKSIGSSAFAGCTGLTSVRTPSSVTSMGSYVFKGCASLIEAEINGTSLSLSSSSGIFDGCERLQRATFGDGVTRLYSSYLCEAYGANTRSGTFGNSPNLQRVSIGAGITEVPTHFMTGCGNPEDGVFVSFEGQINRVYNYAFNNGNVTSLNLSLANCVVDSYAFSGCPAVTPNSVNFSQIVSIGERAFSGCKQLTSVRTSSLLTLVGSYAFYGCTSLVDVEINGTGLSLYNSPGIFENCPNIRYATFGDGVTRLYSSYLCEAYGANTRSGTFGNSPNLQRVSIGTGITEVPPHFTTKCGNSTNGVSISFGGQISRVYNNAFNNGNITNLNVVFLNCMVDSYAFTGCPANIDGILFTQIKSIGERAFSNCSGLTSVKTSSLLTSIGSYAFSGCIALFEVEINGTGLSLYNSPGIFENCPNIRYVTFGDGVTRLYSSYLCEAYGANTRSGVFGVNPNLQRVSVGSGITEVPPHFMTGCGNSSVCISVSFGGQISRVYNNAFNNSNITNLNLTLVNCAVDSYAFSGCPANMDKLDFAQIRTIGERAFSNCSGITSVMTSELLTSLGSYAFSSCASLIEAEINGSDLSLYNSPGVFENCRNLRYATLGNGVTRLYCSNFSESYGSNPRSGTFGYGPSLQCVSIGSGVVEVPPHFMTGCGNSDNGVSVSFGGQVCRVYNNAFNNSNITNLNIKFSNCAVDSYAFAGCPANLDDIGFKEVKSIGERAFSGCSGLTSVRTSSLLTSLGSSVFLGCTSLVEAEINGTGLDLYYSSYLFKSCSNLRSVILGNGVMRLYPSRDSYYQNGTRYISGMFGFCSKLQSVSIGSGVCDVPEYFMFDVGNAEDKLVVSFGGQIGRVGAYALNNANITRLCISPENCTVDSYAFSGCPAVMLNNVDFSRIVSIGERAFQNCQNMVGDLDLQMARTIVQYAFSGCTGLTSVRTSETLATLGQYAFIGCSSLISAEINGTNLNLYNSPGIFENCSNLRRAIFGDGVIRLYSSNLSESWGSNPRSGTFGNCNNLNSISVGSGVTEIPPHFTTKCGNSNDGISVSFRGQVNRIYNNAFNSSSVTNLNITLTNCTVDSYAFSGCPANMDNVDFTQIKSIGERAFSECSGLTSVRTSSLLTSLAQYAFYGCSSLVEAEINGTNLNLERSAGLFKSCGNLRSVIFGDGVTRLYTSRDSYYQNGTHYISGTFGFCSRLQSVSIGSGVSEVPEYFMFDVGNAEDKLVVSFRGQMGRVGYYAMNNVNVTNLIITLTNCTVDSYAFSGCPAVAFDSVNFSQITSIGERGFQSCVNIFGDLDLSLIKSIGQYAFSNCRGISSAKFGSTLTSIGSSAFSSCTNASSFVFAGNPPSVGSSAFNNVKRGARGYYTSANAAAWEAVIDAQHMWNGLLMGELPRVVAKVVSADVVAGSITLGWNFEDYPDGTTFKVLRTVGNESLYQVTSGVTSGTFTDVEFSKAGCVGNTPCFDPVAYQVEPEFGDLSELRSAIVQTRNRYGLFVGIDKYQSDTLSELGACVSDADGWKAALTTYGGCRVPQRIVDETGTKENILKALGDWAKQVKPGDTFFYTHSGHGDVDVLRSYKSTSGYTSEDITASEFATALMEFPKGVGIIVVLDTCSSGSILPTRKSKAKSLLSATPSAAVRSFAESVMGAMNTPPKRRLLSAAAPDENETYPKITSGDEIGWLTAVDPIQDSLDGVYSHECLQIAGWKYGGADYDKDGTVDFYELGEFAAYWLGRTFDEYGMTPQMFSPSILPAICAGRIPSPNVYEKVAAPADVTASTNEPYRVTVSWSAVSGAENYCIAWTINGESSFDYTTGLSKKFHNLSPETELSVYVKAVNKMDVSLPSKTVEGIAKSNEDVETRVTNYDWSICTARENPINYNGTINYDKLNIDHDGDGMTSLQECIAGTDPLNDKSKFAAKISLKANGEPEVTWEPNTPELRAIRVYRTLGKVNLTDANWVDVTDKDQSEYRFFKVTVDLP